MKQDFELVFSSARGLSVRSAQGAFPVLTPAEAARRLKRSRRQVYRLLKAGTLTLRVKALGECLIDEPSVARLAAAPAARQRLPAALAPLLPEYALADLNAGRHRDLVLARVLESGGEALAAWALARYGRRGVASFLKRRGASLTPRSLAFWEAMLGVRAGPGPAWRRGGAWRA